MGAQKRKRGYGVCDWYSIMQNTMHGVSFVGCQLTSFIFSKFKFDMKESIDVVYHLASITDSENAFQISDKFYRMNLSGTLNVPGMCRVNEINKIVFDMRK